MPFIKLIFLFSVLFFISCQNKFTTEILKYNIDKTRFTGTLYKPLNPGPHPLILIAHGSGDYARDFFFYKPYGEYFSEHGIAVFIFDKRGVGDSDGIFPENPNFQQLASDLSATFKFVSNLNEIDKNNVGILGISQAAWVIPIALGHLNNVAFVVCTSCPSVSPNQSDLFQKARELAESGFSATDIDEIITYNQSVTEYVASFKGREKVLNLKQTYKDRSWFKEFNYNPELSIEDTLKKPQYDHYRTAVFDPIPYWKKNTVPTLFIYGEKDSHIPVVKSINRIKEELNNTSLYKVKRFINTGHLIQTVNDSIEKLNLSIFDYLKGRPYPQEDYLEFVKNWIIANNK